MACRKLCRQIIVTVPRRYRCTAAPTAPSACPFHFGGKKTEISEDKTHGEPKPYESIPTPKGLPLVGTLFDIIKNGGAAKMHEHCDKRHKKLGPIFREKLGTVDAVVISDHKIMSAVYSSEGSYPRHLVPEAWQIYNEMKGIKRGLFFMDGPHWQKRRKFLNQALLSKEAVQSQSKFIAEVAEEYVEKFAKLAAESEDGIIRDLETHLYKWSVETLMAILFGRRLEKTPENERKLDELVRYVQQIFKESAKLSIISPKLAATVRLPTWKSFETAADNALGMARELTLAVIEEIMKGSRENPGLIDKLAALDDCGIEEIVCIIADLILAAADTTSHAIQWMLYLLAKHPKYQVQLYNDICQVLPPGEKLTMETADQVPLLTWIIKETLRRYPIASFLTRYTTEDVILGGYKVPKGTLTIMSQYTMGHDPEHFKNPHEFYPERWRRVPNGEHQNLSKGCQPFGTGVRACIGKRIAEAQLKIFAGKIFLRFRLHSMNDVDRKLRMITTPDKPILLKFEERKPRDLLENVSAHL